MNFGSAISQAGWGDRSLSLPSGGPSAPGRRSALKAARAKKIRGPLRCAPTRFFLQFTEVGVPPSSYELDRSIAHPAASAPVTQQQRVLRFIKD